jgi:Mg2+-importing ATPase
MGASSNFGNMFSMLGGTLLLPFEPMLSIQILVNNLLYDFSQLAIPTDNVDEEFLRTPRKWNIDNVKKFMIYVGPISSIFDYATFALMWFVFRCSLHAVDGDHQEQLFHTGWFVESLLTQTMIVHIIRTNRIPFLQSSPSLPLVMGTLVVMAIGSYLPYSPFAASLHMVPLPGAFWLWMAAFMVCYAFLCHGAKMWFYRKFGAD